MLKDKLGIDDKDVQLFSLYIKNPDISQTELAKSLNISQPSINARVYKLKKKGILASTVGIEFNKSDLYLTRIDFTASNAEDILNELKNDKAEIVVLKKMIDNGIGWADLEGDSKPW